MRTADSGFTVGNRKVEHYGHFFERSAGMAEPAYAGSLGHSLCTFQDQRELFRCGQ